jgi:galactose mutarotase-like enzyme
MGMFHYTIESDTARGLDRIVNRRGHNAITLVRHGGELIGYNVFDPVRKKELPVMWRNNDPKQPGDGSWENHATILFPIVGGLVNKQSKLGNRVIKSRSEHGFPHHSIFSMAGSGVHENAAFIHYQLKPNDEIRGYYPFEFILDLVYTLEENRVTLAFSVTNTERNRDIFFSFGWHPGFNTDWGLGAKKEDWKFVFKKGTYDSYQVNQDCFLTGEIKKEQLNGPVMWDEKTLQGTILLAIDKVENRICTLYNQKLHCGVRVDFADYPHFGLWSQVGRPFFCLEPWQGMDDHLEQKPFDQKFGIIKLTPGNRITKMASITPIFDQNRL